MIDLPSNANGKSSIAPVAPLHDGHLSSKVTTGAVEDLMIVAVLCSREASMGVACGAVVGVVVGVGHDF